MVKLVLAVCFEPFQFYVSVLLDAGIIQVSCKLFIKRVSVRCFNTGPETGKVSMNPFLFAMLPG